MSYQRIFILVVTTRDFNHEIAAFVTTKRFDEASFYSNYIRECTRVTVPAVIGASGYPSEERAKEKGEGGKTERGMILFAGETSKKRSRWSQVVRPKSAR